MILRSRFLLCLVVTALALVSACSVPNLEQPECTESRDAVKDFYSFHIGNDMAFSPENLKLRERFLTPDYFKTLLQLGGDKDVFTTNSQDYPKAFRVGGCKVIDPKKTSVEILLFWKSDSRSEQKTIHAETVNKDGKWLINSIEN